MGVLYNIYNISSDFKIGTRLGFAKAHHKIPYRRKCTRGPRLEEFPKILQFPFNICAATKLVTSNLAYRWGLPRPTIKPHPKEKWTHPWDRKAFKYLGFTLVFLQRPRCPLSVSGASCLAYYLLLHSQSTV